jgi:hypothetical protein
MATWRSPGRLGRVYSHSIPLYVSSTSKPLPHIYKESVCTRPRRPWSTPAPVWAGPGRGTHLPPGPRPPHPTTLAERLGR